MNRTIAELVETHPFFVGLPDDAAAMAAGCARNVVFEPGALLVTEGAPAQTFYLLRRGRVAIEVRSPGRSPIAIEMVEPGAVIGWSWLVPPYHWTFDARARGRVGAIAIDAECLRNKAQAEPAFGYALLGRVAQELLSRLQATRMRLLDLYEEPLERS